MTHFEWFQKLKLIEIAFLHRNLIEQTLFTECPQASADA
jgi:hypothetical protein